MRKEVEGLEPNHQLAKSDLIKWLDYIEQKISVIDDDQPTPIDPDIQLATYAEESANSREEFRSVVLQGQGVIKITSLINGGAAVAMLAFIGTLIKEGKIYPELLHIFSGSILLFVFGVLASALTAGTTYLFQACQNQGSSKLHKIVVRSFHVFGICFIIISYLCFLFGSMEAIEAFRAIRN